MLHPKAHSTSPEYIGCLTIPLLAFICRKAVIAIAIPTANIAPPRILAISGNPMVGWGSKGMMKQGNSKSIIANIPDKA